MTTATSEGSRLRNARTAASPSDVPVGLLGVHSRTRRVRPVTAAAMASRSCSPDAVSGTVTGVAPASWARIGYASNERHAKTISSPASQAAPMICARTPVEPGPTTTWSASRPTKAAMAALTSVFVMSG